MICALELLNCHSIVKVQQRTALVRAATATDISAYAMETCCSCPLRVYRAGQTPCECSAYACASNVRELTCATHGCICMLRPMLKSTM